MSINRHDKFLKNHSILTRPKRLSSVLIQPQVEDFGQSIELPKGNTSILPSIYTKQNSAIRNQIKKYKNLSLFDKSLFINRKDNRENRENIHIAHDQHDPKLKMQRNSYSHNDQLKITKLNAQQLLKQEHNRLPFNNASLLQKQEQINNIYPKATVSTNNNLYSRKPSAIEVDQFDLEYPLHYLPSIRGWEQLNNNTNRSNQ